MISNESVLRSLNSRCEFPECCCGRIWQRYQDAEIEPGEVENARIVIHAMLACVGHRCPSAKFRLKALDQLSKPIFNEKTGTA